MNTRIYYFLWACIAIVFLFNMRLDVMEVDAAQYASISAEMKATGNYLQVYHHGRDYLDKPPLLFWLASASMRLFGNSNVAYKLPALLTLLLGLWSTFRFVLLYDRREIAYIAVTLLATTQAYFLMTNDVRTDGLLTGFTMFSVFHCAAFLKYRKRSHVVYAGLGIGLAMLSKGPLGALIPVVGVLADRLLKGQWKDLFKPQWIVAAGIAVLILAPMCYGLYTQFDLHPEKTVYGLQGPSGLRFFFWIQSFGRITGELYWDNHAPPYFFLLTFLWDFMPWTIIFLGAIIYFIRRWRALRSMYPEFISAGAFILVLMLLSFSHYKLPHYIFPLFPFAAILTARYLDGGIDRSGRGLVIAQFTLMHFLAGAMVFVFLKGFPPQNVVVPLCILIGFGVMWYAFLKIRDQADRILIISAVMGITFNFFLAAHFYPNLMQYQSGAAAGKLIALDRQQTHRLYYTFPRTSYTADFYSGAYVPDITMDALAEVPAGSWVFTTESGLGEIQERLPGQFEIVKTFEDYHISTLKMAFVLKTSRPSQVKNAYLLEKK